MTKEELLETIGNGETSRVQLKADLINAVSIAEEMVAFAHNRVAASLGPCKPTRILTSSMMLRRISLR